MGSDAIDCEAEANRLVEEFLRRGLVSTEVAERAETLVARDEPTRALEVILAERRPQSVADVDSEERGSSPPSE